MHKSWSSCVEIMSIEGPLRTATRAQDEDNTGTTWKASGRMDGAHQQNYSCLKMDLFWLVMT